MGDSRRGSERYIEIHYLIFKTMELLLCLMKNVIKCTKKSLPIPVSSRSVEENEGFCPLVNTQETIARAQTPTSNGTKGQVRGDRISRLGGGQHRTRNPVVNY